MTSNGFDAASDARFRATVEIEQRHLWRQMELLWEHNAKRRREIEAVAARINGSILCAAGILAAVLFGVVRPKLGL